MLVQNISCVSIFNCTSDSSLFQYRLLVEKLKDELSKFGLTENQVKVFLYLSKYGTSTASKICSSLGLPRTETYQILNSLQNKGVINSKICHPTLFSSLSLKKALSILISSEKTRISNLENNESKLSNIWDKIPSFDYSKNEINDNLQMLQGINVIFAKINEMFNSTKNNIKVVCNEKDLARFYREGFFDNLANTVNPKFIVSSDRKKLTSYTEIKSLRKNVSYIKNLSNQCFIIRDSCEVLFFLRNMRHPKSQIFAFVTSSSSLIQSLELLFDNLSNQGIISTSRCVVENKFSLHTQHILELRKIMAQFDDIENDLLLDRYPEMMSS